MAISVQCTDVIKRSGKVYVRWNDKIELEFASLKELKDFVAEIDRNEVRDILRRIALAKYLKADPNANNPNALIGRTIALDLDAAANLVRVS